MDHLADTLATLAEKIGVVVPLLWAETVRAEFWRGVIGSALGVAICGSVIAVGAAAYRHRVDYERLENRMALTAISVIVGLVGAIALAMVVYNNLPSVFAPAGQLVRAALRG